MRKTARSWIVLAALLAALAGPALAPARAHSRPSVIQIVTDDATAEMFGPRTTPIIWREIAAKGTAFTRAVTTSPACCPSRATMLTGQYGHNNGVLANHPGYPALRGKRNVLPTWLRRVGYETFHVGKLMHGIPVLGTAGAVPEPGWTGWWGTRTYRYDESTWAINGEVRHFAPEPRNQTTRLVNRIATRRIGAAEPPFFLQVSHFAPHGAVLPDDGSPCVGHARPAGPLNVPLGSTSPRRGPAYGRPDPGSRPLVIEAWGAIDELREQRIEARYQCAVAALAGVDRGVGRLLAELRERRLLAQTAIIVTSDNGYLWGQHGVGPAKHAGYREAIGVPLLIRLPRALRPQQTGVRSRARVALIDLAPTILDLASGEPCRRPAVCRRLDGRSLVPAARGRSERWQRTRAIGIELDSGDWICSYRGAQAPEGTYIRHTEIVLERALASEANPCVPGSFVEAYDAASDPAQLHNLATDPYADPAFVERLAARAERVATCSGIEGRDSPPPPNRSYCE